MKNKKQCYAYYCSNKANENCNHGVLMFCSDNCNYNHLKINGISNEKSTSTCLGCGKEGNGNFRFCSDACGKLFDKNHNVVVLDDDNLLFGFYRNNKDSGCVYEVSQEDLQNSSFYVLDLRDGCYFWTDKKQFLHDNSKIEEKITSKINKGEVYRSSKSGQLFEVYLIFDEYCIMMNVVSKLKFYWKLNKFFDNFTRCYIDEPEEKPSKIDFIQAIKAIKKEEFEIIEERNKIYGNSFEKVGQILAILFPDGIKINSEIDHIKFDLLKNLVGKITRFSNNFPAEFHKDSIIDIANYATILLSVSNNINNKK